MTFIVSATFGIDALQCHPFWHRQIVIEYERCEIEGSRFRDSSLLQLGDPIQIREGAVHLGHPVDRAIDEYIRYIWTCNLTAAENLQAIFKTGYTDDVKHIFLLNNLARGEFALRNKLLWIAAKHVPAKNRIVVFGNMDSEVFNLEAGFMYMLHDMLSPWRDCELPPGEDDLYLNAITPKYLKYIALDWPVYDKLRDILNIKTYLGLVIFPIKLQTVVQ